MSATAPRPSVAFLPVRRRGPGSRGRGQERRGSWRIAALCAGVLAAFLAAPSPARADGLADGQALFARGRDLRLRGDCANAVPFFRRASEVYPAGLGSLRNLAECEESLGHLAPARRAWLDLGHALLSNHDPKYSGWALDAEQGAERLRPAEPLAPDAAAGDVKESRPTEVAPAVMAAPPPGSHEAREVPRTGATRTVGWVALGVGGASLIGAGVALLVRQVELVDLPPCAATQCSPSQKGSIQPTEDRGHAAATLTNVLGVVGLAGVATGLVLLWVGRPHSTDAALLVSPTGLFATGRF